MAVYLTLGSAEQGDVYSMELDLFQAQMLVDLVAGTDTSIPQIRRIEQFVAKAKAYLNKEADQLRQDIKIKQKLLENIEFVPEGVKN